MMYTYFSNEVLRELKIEIQFTRTNDFYDETMESDLECLYQERQNPEFTFDNINNFFRNENDDDNFIRQYRQLQDIKYEPKKVFYKNLF